MFFLFLPSFDLVPRAYECMCEELLVSVCGCPFGLLHRRGSAAPFLQNLFHVEVPKERNHILHLRSKGGLGIYPKP